MLVNNVYGLAGTQWFQYLVLYSGWVDLLVRVLYYTPVAFFSAAALTLGWKIRTRSWSEKDEAALLVLSTGGFLCLTNISFPAFHYITPTLLSIIGLATYASHHLGPRGAARESGPMRRFVGWSSVAAVAIYFAASAVALHLYLGVPRAPVHTARGTVWVESETATLWNDIIDHTRRELSADDRIFVFPYFPLFYFMSDQEHPSRYVALGPGLPGTEAEDEIIHQLEDEEIQFLLNASGVQYPGLERFENAYPRLHHYLTSRYIVEREFEGSFGPYAQFLRRRPAIGNEPGIIP
jgi:hypothetical protein